MGGKCESQEIFNEVRGLLGYTLSRLKDHLYVASKSADGDMAGHRDKI